MAILFSGSVAARSPDRDILSFSIQTNVGFGNNIHVVGSHPDVGSWNPVESLKLRWTPGNVWTGQVAVQKGTALSYKFISRNGAANLYHTNTNVAWEPGADRLTNTTSAAPAPYPGKTIYYYSGWTSAAILAVSATNVFHPMTRIGQGRTAGEFLYRVDGVGEAGEWLEFVANGWFNGTNYWDNAPFPGFNNNYYTRLDAFLLQDGSLFNYWPSNSVSPPRVVSNLVNSSYSEITGRLVRIYLPRGYDSHSWKRYPVIYMQDGTNVFSPGGSFGSWDADLTATKEISQGRMRETIIAAIDNAPNRRVEYNPTGSTYPGEPPGHADKYLRYLADNVRPTLDVNFRTLNDRRNTFVGGSSMGGIFSVYAGYETNLFGGIIAMSPSFTRAGNYTTSLWSRTRAAIRIYMDTGDSEGQVGITPGGNYWDSPWEGYNIFLSHGFAPNEDLLMRIGYTHVHNEAAWRERLPTAFRFILPAHGDPNRIAAQEWPPVISGMNSATSITFTTRQWTRYSIEAMSTSAWFDAGVNVVETNAWDSRELTVTNKYSDTVLFRVTGSTDP